MKFGLGYKRDTPDPRDKHFAALGLTAALPAASSLQDHVVEVLDQGETSSCVAHAWAQALRIADIVAGVKNPPLPSREFIYYGARKYDGGEISDNGTQLRSAAKAITKFGRPPESAWPFDPIQINAQPPWEAFREGYDWKGPAGYLRVSTLIELRQAIFAGKPVVGGTDVGESIMNYSGGVYDPDPNEEKIGGHALCFVAYDSSSFTIVNSWGPGYGESGFIRVSPRFAQTFTDLWAVHL